MRVLWGPIWREQGEKMTARIDSSLRQVSDLIQARKRHIDTNVLVQLFLARPQECPRDKPRFLLILHNGSPVRPRDKPSLSLGPSRGRKVAERVYVLKDYVPFSLPIDVRNPLSLQYLARTIRRKDVAKCRDICGA